MIRERIKRLRGLMAEKNISFYMVSVFDSFLSEFTLEEDNRLAYITGFTGSSGIAIISKNDLIFFT